MGSHFIRHLYTTYPGYQITNFDLLTYAGNPDNLADIEALEKEQPHEKRRYTFIQGDICDEVAIDKVLQSTHFDIVLNFAAESHVDRSILNAMVFIRTNVQGAYVLLEAARVHKIPRFVYISTDEIYGDIPLGMKSDEEYPFRPTNPYAASKASADLLAQAYMKTHKVPLLIVRGSNNYGSHQYPEKLHPLVITNLLEGRPIPLHGDGQHMRSWLHVSDFCAAVDLVMHKAQDYSVYNLEGEERSNIQVVETIARLLGKDFKEHANFITDRPGPDFRYSVDGSRIVRELGWRREQQYETAVQELITWYQANTAWWQKVRSKPAFIQHYRLQSKGYESFEESGHTPGRF